jgi:hypothetical protein
MVHVLITLKIVSNVTLPQARILAAKLRVKSQGVQCMVDKVELAKTWTSGFPANQHSDAAQTRVIDATTSDLHPNPKLGRSVIELEVFSEETKAHYTVFSLFRA